MYQNPSGFCFLMLISTVAQKCHGNFNFITAISTLFTAISISPRQFQLRSRQFHFHHGNFNLTTAISISPRQFQLRSRQFQFHHGNFNFVHGNFNFTTAISTSSRQFQFYHGNFFINSDRPVCDSHVCV